MIEGDAEKMKVVSEKELYDPKNIVELSPKKILTVKQNASVKMNLTLRIPLTTLKNSAILRKQKFLVN